MFAFRVIEHFDVIEDILSCLLAVFVCPTTDAFTFEQIKEALGNGIVMAIAAPAHRMFNVVGPQKCGPIPAGVLRALIGVDQHGSLWFAPPNSHG